MDGLQQNFRTLQHNFIMDGYHRIKITPLGHLKVLISSSEEGEVRELVGTVGWWCNWFEKFEEWSPSWVSNQRAVWLNCYGIPLHVWGDAMFRTLGFKFGTFVEVDLNTKNMMRGDVARIKIATDASKVIDSSISVVVLGVKFVIRVVEDVGGLCLEDVRCCGSCVREVDTRSLNGSGDGNSAAEEVGDGVSENGDDSDWSESRQQVLESEAQHGGKGEITILRIEGAQGKGISVCDPTCLGNSLGKEPHTVNGILADKEDELLKSGVVHVEVSEKHVDSRLEEDCVGGSNLQVCTRAGNAGKDGVMGPRLFLKDGVFGPKDPQPICLRTRLRDLPLTLVEGGGGVSKATEVEEVGLVNGGVGGSVVINSILSDPVHGEKGSLHLVNNSLSVPDRCMCGRTKKSTRRANPYPQGSKYRKFQELCKGGSKPKKKQGVRSDS
jgi:hypothetical protein